MQTYFSGRLLGAESFRTEQSYQLSSHGLPGPRTAEAAAASLAHSHDDVALNPQPLPPKSMSDALLSRLPHSALDKVALNPQPLPPREAATGAAPVPRDGGDPPPGELDMLKLQSLLSQREQAFALLSNLIKALNDSTHTIARNLRG